MTKILLHQLSRYHYIKGCHSYWTPPSDFVSTGVRRILIEINFPLHHFKIPIRLFKITALVIKEAPIWGEHTVWKSANLQINNKRIVAAQRKSGSSRGVTIGSLINTQQLIHVEHTVEVLCIQTNIYIMCSLISGTWQTTL